MLQRLFLFLLLLVVLTATTLFFMRVPDQPVEALIDKWAPPPSTFIDVQGMQVHVRDEGNRNDPTPIVLIHGTSASLHTWDGWVSALTPQRRVIRFDLPAFGLTGPHPNDDYRIETYVSVVNEIMDALGVKQAVIGGNSLGGYVAWATAVLHPDKVSQLVLVDSAGLPFEPESWPLAFLIARSPMLTAILGNVLSMSLVKNSVEDVYSDNTKVTDDLVTRYYELTTREGNRDALAMRFRQTEANAFAERLSEVKQPTLILWGQDDHLIPNALGEQFAQQLENSELIVLPNLGHVPHEEGPRETVTHVIEFLSKFTEQGR